MITQDFCHQDVTALLTEGSPFVIVCRDLQIGFAILITVSEVFLQREDNRKRCGILTELRQLRLISNTSIHSPDLISSVIVTLIKEIISIRK